MNFRLATIEDVPEIVKVNIDTWRTAYKSIFPPEFLRNLSYEEKEIRWRQWFIKPEKGYLFILPKSPLKRL